MLNLLIPTLLIRSGFTKRNIVVLGFWRNRKALLISEIKHSISK